jgi:hypothetical protein
MKGLKYVLETKKKDHFWAWQWLPWQSIFFGFLDNVLRVFWKNIALAFMFKPISIHFFAHNPFLCMINQ